LLTATVLAVCVTLLRCSSCKVCMQRVPELTPGACSVRGLLDRVPEQPGAQHRRLPLPRPHLPPQLHEVAEPVRRVRPCDCSDMPCLRTQVARLICCMVALPTPRTHATYSKQPHDSLTRHQQATCSENIRSQPHRSLLWLHAHWPCPEVAEAQLLCPYPQP